MRYLILLFCWSLQLYAQEWGLGQLPLIHLPAGACHNCPTAYWKLEETSSTADRINALGNPHCDLHTPSSTFTGTQLGIIGNGLHLNRGVNFTTPNAVAGDLDYDPSGEGITVSFWLNISNNTTTSDAEFVFSSGPAGQTIFQFQVYKSNMIATYCDGFGNCPAANTNVILNYQQWYHLVGEYSSVSGLVTIYVNGVLTATSATATPAGYGGAIQHCRVLVQDFGGLGDYVVDELGHYLNLFLSQTEITALYNAGNGARPPNVP